MIEPNSAAESTINSDALLLEERELVQRAKNGDKDALATLYETYFDSIYRYVLARVGESADAEDLTEEVFLRMLRAVHSFQWQQIGFAPWLFRIAHNLVVDYLRRRTYRRSRMNYIAATFIDSVEMTEEIEQKLDNQDLNEAVEQLSAAQRDVITLRFAAGLSVAETASALGKRTGNVKVLQHNALAALRRILENKDKPKKPKPSTGTANKYLKAILKKF